MKTLLRWYWHRLWIWEPMCRVVGSSWNNGKISWTCSCRKSFHLHLWPKETK